MLIGVIVRKSYLTKFDSNLKLISTMAMSQGKKDINLYWNDVKTIK